MQHGVVLIPSCRSLICLTLAWMLLSLATLHVSTPPATAADFEGMRALLAQAQPTAPSPTPPPSLLILPINRAKFLAGARFDFRVEANHLPAKPTAWEVTIAGQTPEVFFGVQGQVTNTSDHSQEQTFRDVTLAEPGTYMVSAKVVAGETTLAASVTYEVVLAKPLARQAKNVLLFIGDGMSLPFRTAARLVSRGMQEGKYRSMLGVPLMRDNTAIGVVVLLRTTVEPFTHKQISLVETFADQALIAIENTRLFEEVQARTKELQDSLDRQTATSEVLARISHTKKCIGAPNQRKFFCNKVFPEIRGRPDDDRL